MSAVFSFADRLTDEHFEHNPVDATHAGVPTDRWNDWSPDGRAAVAAWAATRLGELDALDTTSPWDDLGIRVMRDELALIVDVHDAGEWAMDLNSIWSPPQLLRETFDYMASETADDWSLIASRLHAVDEAVTGYRAGLVEGRSRGLVAAGRQVEAVVRELRAHVGADGYFASLAADQEGRPWGDEVAAGVAVARDALAGLADWLEVDYLPDAAPEDPVGAERHRLAVRRCLRTDRLDPTETYAWGWDEVHRLWRLMGDVADAIVPGGSIPEAFEVLKTDPRRAAHGVDAFRRFIADRLTDAQARLAGTHFDIPERLERLDVVVAPPGGSLGAEYRQPSDDFSRPGAVVYHPGDKTVFPLYDEVSTAYHEGFPGHHLQSAMQVHLADRLTRFHRLVSWNPGYGEGWALYAEHLMGELGFYERPDYEMGLLANQMLRACRVVIDLGCHLEMPVPTNDFGVEAWDFDRAVWMLEHVAFLAADYARSEATRYLGWPAQAISYKVGEQAILDLRDEARSRAWYTDKEFHARVVGHGPVGLDHLRELVLRGDDGRPAGDEGSPRR